MVASLYQVDHHPESWYALAPSRSVRPGRAVPVDALGRRLVLWRTASGEVRAHHRFCPHMGASLANGQVVGDRLRCPFHHWSFDETGRCVHIPYLPDGDIPPGAAVPRYELREHVGWIWVWHGPGAPTHELPALPEYGDRRFGVRERTQLFEVHPLLILENGCDAQHFKYVHRVPFLAYDVEMTREEPHAFGFRVHQALAGPAGTRIDLVTGIEYVGGSTIFGTLERAGELTARFVAAPVPLGPNRTQFTLIVVARRLPPWLRPLDPLYLWWFARSIFNGSTDDYLPIWKDMDPSERRCLVADDRLQQRFRAYYKAHLPQPAA